eukprot:gnl/MRDRNA2_/MRDRNA2_106104_c0_seq1.p1 gnl/MRDRNA2_/MRDRNA2_106104_c0~~gnl/MRDRNA2_/MRDRNA2_106104_c0_seq1.p1  ORF type:complete len:187 (+),score=53.49 gnl/MRDRNA2_/MRDRNA2_106104_c0_seq1:71-631(+)
MSTRMLEQLRACLEDEEFLMEVVMWAWEHCMKFPSDNAQKFEHKLEFTTLHKEYRQMFERRTDEFLEGEDLDAQDVLSEVQQGLKENPSETQALVDALAASEDYMRFVKYMQQIKSRREWAEGMTGGVPLFPSGEAPSPYREEEEQQEEQTMSEKKPVAPTEVRSGRPPRPPREPKQASQSMGNLD